MKKVYTYALLLLASSIPFDLVPREQRLVNNAFSFGLLNKARFLDDLDVVIELIDDPDIAPYMHELHRLPVEVQTIKTYASPGRGESIDIEHQNELTVTIKDMPTHILYAQFMKEDPNTMPQRVSFLKRWFHNVKDYVENTNFYKQRVLAIAEAIKKRCRSDVHVRDSIEGDPSCSDTLFKIIVLNEEEEGLNWTIRPTGIFTSKICIDLI